MSMGYGGGCIKYGEDANTVIYEYYAYSLNDEERDPGRIYDGLIRIGKSSFYESRPRTQLKRNPRGRHFERRTSKSEIPYREYLKSGKVELIRRSLRSRVLFRYGDVGLQLIREIFDAYRETGRIPHSVGTRG